MTKGKEKWRRKMAVLTWNAQAYACNCNSSAASNRPPNFRRHCLTGTRQHCSLVNLGVCAEMTIEGQKEGSGKLRFECQTVKASLLAQTAVSVRR